MSYTGRFDDIISFMAEEKTIDLNRKLNINEVTEYILAIPKFAEKIGTDSLRVLMEKLGNPERKYLTLHVAGTNGKGSTTEMLSLMLTEAGFKAEKISGDDYPDEILPVIGPADYDMNILFRCMK